MSTPAPTFLTPEQYLEIERKAEYKGEYYRGERFAMAGANEAHNLLVASLVSELGQQLRQRRCRVYPSDMRVLVPATGLYTYPDVIAMCGDPQFSGNQQDILLNPALLVEVLSPSTEAYDRGRKFDQYKTIPSLREYLLVASDRIHADLYTRQADGRWLLNSADRREEELALESVGARLRLGDLYELVDVPEERG